MSRGERDVTGYLSSLFSDVPHWPDESLPSKTIEAVNLIEDEDGRTVILDLLESEHFFRMTAIANEFLQNGPVKSEFEDFMLRFRGAFFEVAATKYVGGGLNRHERLFATSEAFEVFARTYPEREPIINGSGLNLGINGVRLPDGIIVRANGSTVYIDGFCEYSLSRHSLLEKAWRYNPRRKKQGFVLDSHLSRREELKRNLAVFIRKHHPELPRKVQFDSQFGIIYVMPKGNGSEDGDESAFGNGTRNRKLFVPLTHKELHRITNGIIEDLNPL